MRLPASKDSYCFVASPEKGAMMQRIAAVLVSMLMLAGVFVSESSAASVPLGTCPSVVAAAKKLNWCTLELVTATDLLGMVSASQLATTTTFNVDGTPYNLRLWENPIFTQDYRAQSPLIIPLAGTIVGQPGSEVRLTIDIVSQTVEGVLISAGESRFIEPVSGMGPLHVSYPMEAANIDTTFDGDGVPAQPYAEQTIQPQIPPPESWMADVPEAPGNQTGEGGPLSLVTQPSSCVSCVTKVSDWLHAYWDVTDPTSVLNSLDPYLVAENVKLRVVAKTQINTNGKQTTCGSSSSTDLLNWFKTNYPLLGSGTATAEDRAHLFTNNGANLGGFSYYGCGNQPGSHAWSAIDTTDMVDKVVKTMHEMGHTFGAPHDNTATSTVSHTASAHPSPCNYAHTHKYYTVMWQGPPFGCDLTSSTSYSATSRGQMQLNNFPRRISYSDPYNTESGHGVQLQHFEIIYPTNLVSGATIHSMYRVYYPASGSLPAKLFWGARNCPSSNPSCSTNADFGKYWSVTMTNGVVFQYAAQLTLGSGSGGFDWHIWPAFCHVHSDGSCSHWGPYKWYEIVLPVS